MASSRLKLAAASFGSVISASMLAYGAATLSSSLYGQRASRLSPKARYPLTVTRVQQVQQVLRGEEVQQGEGVLVPYGEGEASFPMNINQATAEDLMEADRIGEKRAQDILDFIAARGGISDMDELLEIEGIGEATLAGLKELFYAE